MDIEQLEVYTALRCVPHYDYGYFTRFLVICQFFPLYLTIGMWAMTFIYKYQEIYFRFFSIGLTLNWLLNLALQYMFRQRPHIQGCGGGYSMPSWHSQHVFFFYTIVITYLIIQKRHMGAFNLLLLNAVPALVCASRLTLGFNTFSELMVGNIVGVAFAAISQLVVFKWLRPKVPKLLEYRLVQWLGYRDHLLNMASNDSDGEEERYLSPRSFDKELEFTKATCIFCQLGTAHQIHI